MMNSDEDLMQNYLKYCGESMISEAMKEVITNIGHPKKILKEVRYS